MNINDIIPMIVLISVALVLCLGFGVPLLCRLTRKPLPETVEGQTVETPTGYIRRVSSRATSMGTADLALREELQRRGSGIVGMVWFLERPDPLFHITVTAGQVKHILAMTEQAVNRKDEAPDIVLAINSKAAQFLEQHPEHAS